MIDDWAKCLDNQGLVDTFILNSEKKPLTLPLMHFLKANSVLSYGIGGKTMKWIDVFLCWGQHRGFVNGIPTDDLSPETGAAEINTQCHIKYPLLVQTPINLASFHKLSGTTGMASLILLFPLLRCWTNAYLNSLLL